MVHRRLRGAALAGIQGSDRLLHHVARSSTRPIPERDFVRGYSTCEILRGHSGPVSTLRCGVIVFGAPSMGEPITTKPMARLFDRTAGNGRDRVRGSSGSPTTSVTLDPDLVDSDGIPAPKVTYRLERQFSQKMLDHSVARSR